MTNDAVLFDLGNTLVHYYHGPTFPPMLGRLHEWPVYEQAFRERAQHWETVHG